MNKKLNKHKLQIIRPTEAFGLIGWLAVFLILFMIALYFRHNPGLNNLINKVSPFVWQNPFICISNSSTLKTNISFFHFAKLNTMTTAIRNFFQHSFASIKAPIVMKPKKESSFLLPIDKFINLITYIRWN